MHAKRHGFDAERLGRFKRLDAIVGPYFIIIVVILTSLSRIKQVLKGLDLFLDEFLRDLIWVLRTAGFDVLQQIGSL